MTARKFAYAPLSAILVSVLLAGAANELTAAGPPPPGPMPPPDNQKLAHDIFKDIVDRRSEIHEP
jgi:hypothetical protein